MNKSETMRTKFCGNNFLGKGFRKTSADSFFLNLDVASGGGGVWGGILRLLLFLFWRNSGGLAEEKHQSAKLIFSNGKCFSSARYSVLKVVALFKLKTPLYFLFNNSSKTLNSVIKSTVGCI